MSFGDGARLISLENVVLNTGLGLFLVVVGLWLGRML